MLLSSLIGSDSKPYLEYGWVTTPNTAGQSIPANTITTLTIDTEVADTGNFGSIASNQITLAGGTYYFEGHVNLSNIGNSQGGNTLSLYNVTSSQYVTRGGFSPNSAYSSNTQIKGQFTISNSATFELRILNNSGGSVQNHANLSSNSTAGADQRTTLKLWKLA
jgi:hypothetical protein